MRSIIVLDISEDDGKIYDDQRDMATHSVMGMESIKDGVEGVVVADVSTVFHEKGLRSKFGWIGLREHPHVQTQGRNRNGC